jgi:hypothetical protein
MKCLLLEAFIVGIYSAMIYLPFSILQHFSCSMQKCVNIEIYILVFYVGFFKHFLGYYFGIQSYFCHSRQKGDATACNLLLFSIIEGFSFMMFYFLLHHFLFNPLFTIFVTGILLHIVSEYTGIHDFFVKQCCLNH